MLHQTAACYGDSMTYGARCVMGFPEYLAKKLRQLSKWEWVVLNDSVCGDTALQLLRRMDRNKCSHEAARIATVMIGTNDAKSGIQTSPVDFEEIYHQILSRLIVKTDMSVYCLSIPKMYGLKLSPYSESGNLLIVEYNKRILELCKSLSIVFIDLDSLGSEYFSDGVHFNDSGSQVVASKIAERIMAR